MKPRFFALVWFVLGVRLIAADVQPGRLIERVACASVPSQTYALYVPTGYSPAKNWPVIYCFDPGARGITPVERLQAAAEKYGYIVAGSNVSRNGDWDRNFKAIAAMTRDVADRFSIDARRVYSTGMSGGARVAMQIAVDGYSKGVIACSAGFPAEIPASVKFPVFGTAGTEDMNYFEMKKMEAALEERGAGHRVVIFPGGHEWASVELLTQGVEWLELRAMNAGTRAKDSALIAALRQKRFAALPTGETATRWRELKSMIADFKELTDTVAIEREVKELAAAPSVKAAIKVDRTLLEREEALDRKLADLIEARTATKEKEARVLVARAAVEEDSPDRQMVRRRIASFQSMVRENVRWLFEDRRYNEAANALELAALLRPSQSRTFFDLARARSFARDPKRALEALRQAAAAGFSDAPRAEAEPAFEKLKTEPAFAEILATMRRNPPETEGRGAEMRGRGFGRSGL